jgi:molybdopterin molybdotransferase
LKQSERDVVKARLARNLESVSGRDDFIRVRLVEEGGNWIAEPIFGKSGLISTLVEADGLLHVDRNTEGLYRGDDGEGQDASVKGEVF